MDVAVGMCAKDGASIETLQSLANMWHSCPEFESRLLTIKGGCADLAGNRNKLVRLFLSREIEWLLTVDTDMVWEVDDWERLRDSALNHPAQFVSGTYMVANDPPQPCATIFIDEGFHLLKLTDETQEMYQVHACGAGFSLIHRDVFLKSGDPDNDHEWYEHGLRAPNGQTLPEDYAFCSRVGEAGIPIYLNTKVRLGHVKSRVVGWKEYIDG